MKGRRCHTREKVRTVETEMLMRSPRLAGVVEQFQRLRWLLGSADKAPNAETRFRVLILAVYPARAMTEIMLEAAMKQELQGYQDSDEKKTRDEFESTHLSSLPFYLLIEKIRIHDFHRFGCTPVFPGVLLRGPLKLTASAGEVAIALPVGGEGGKQVVTTGKSKVQEQRPLLQRGDEFWDDASNAYLKLDQILVPFINAVQPVIAKFESLIK
jgi:hypothetical protein